MTKKLPIWLKDSEGKNYHVKENASGEPYITSGRFTDKLIRMLTIKSLPVGTQLEANWNLYGDPVPEFFFVVRNDYLNIDPLQAVADALGETKEQLITRTEANLEFSKDSSTSSAVHH